MKQKLILKKINEVDKSLASLTNRKTGKLLISEMKEGSLILTLWTLKG